MLQRSKYSLNGLYIYGYFLQHLENDEFPMFNIGDASGIHWYIQFKKRVRDRSTVAYSFIHSNGKLKTRIRVYFNILKEDGSSCWEKEVKLLCLRSGRGCVGQYMDIEELLDEKNGNLDDGVTTVEYGLQVESVEGEDGIWRFNFCDKFFDWQTKDNTFEFTTRYGSVFSHKQIMKLHSTTIVANKNSAPVPSFFGSDPLHMCLQITHGVRLQMDAIDYQNVARVAFYLGFSNTVRYCEEQLIVMEPKLDVRLFKLAVKCNMRCYLNYLLKQMETKKQLIKIMRKLDLEKMSSDSMKAIATKIFSL